MSVTQTTDMIIRYIVLPECWADMPTDVLRSFTVCVERTSYIEDRWAVRTNDKQCLNRRGGEVWEPLPSSRSDYWRVERVKRGLS